MADLTDLELALALNGECHTTEVVLWLAREVKRWREAQFPVRQSSDLTDAELALALNGECHTTEVVVWLAREVKRYRKALQVLGATRSQMPEIFSFVTVLHCEVVLRSKEGQSEDIEMTPDEADRVASLLRATVKGALDGWYGAWNHCDHLETTCTVQLSGNADVEIVSCIVSSSPGERQVILRHKDGESQDIVLTPIEADQIADQLRAAAAAARTAVR